MKYKLKLIMYTILGYLIDVLIYGGILGLCIALLTYISYLFIDIEDSRTFFELVLQGILFYWIFDSISAKFREEYKEAKKWLDKNKEYK